MVDVITCWLGGGAAYVDTLSKVLSVDERARAAAFVSDSARQRYVAARVALRRLVAQHVGGRAEDVRFGYGVKGKPYLLEPLGSVLRFNVAHCEDLAVIAITDGAAVGVDVERVRALPDMDAVAPVFMQATELAVFRGVGGAERENYFFRQWTRREAFAKLGGEGLAAVLESAEEPQCWFYEWEPTAGYVAALAMETEPQRIVVKGLEATASAP